jgi:muconolactone delta-isomerase
MLFMVRFDVQQPVDMTQAKLFQIWNEEAKAAQGARDAGAVTGLWKVAGQRTVFAILDVPEHRTVDQALNGLPIIQQLGGSVTTTALPVYDYAEWAEDLRQAVEGG